MPAILLGGPPHAGKSVLAYYLSQSLRRLGLPHYLTRAAPDGEGDWTQEGEARAMQAKRRKGAWSQGWIAINHANIASRQLPLLVDVGGLPTPEQKALFAACTHAILLTKTPADHAAWLEDARAFGLPLLADLTSVREGETRLRMDGGVVRGQVGGLERNMPLEAWPGQQACAPLLDQVAGLITACQSAIYQKLIGGLPADAEFFDFGALGRQLYPADPAGRFVEGDLADVMRHVPPQTPLASYGRIPSWLAAQLGKERDVVWQFSANDGWVRIPELRIAPPGVAVNATNRQFLCQVEDAGGDPVTLRLEVKTAAGKLNPAECAGDALPFIPPERGIRLDGRLPLWLIIAIARAYRHHPRVTGPQAQM